MTRLEGKTVLITGGSRGIGAAIAQRLAEDGADVALTYRTSEGAAEAVVRACRAQGARAEAFCADAASRDDMTGLVDRVVTRFDGLDVLVNNAGIFAVSPLTETTDEEFDRMVDVNIRAVFLLAREAAQVMPEGGRIINIGSNLSERIASPGLGLYAMSKFAVAGLTRGLARDLGPKGITVNCVQPGSTDTDMNPADPTENPSAEGQRASSALGRYGRPEEIAHTVAFLASPSSAYLTGAAINVDGGQNA